MQHTNFKRGVGEHCRLALEVEPTFDKYLHRLWFFPPERELQHQDRDSDRVEAMW